MPIKGAATVITGDREYPKTSTLHCSWATPMCWFATGVESNQVQDSIYGVNRATGATVFIHRSPAGIYYDNLVLDYETDTLYAIAVDFQARTTRVVGWDGATGNITGITDLTGPTRGAFALAGAVSYCTSLKRMFVGLDAQDGQFSDRVMVVDLAGGAAGARVDIEFPLVFPVPTGVRAFCNATAVVAIIGNTIQSDSEDRETALVGDIIAAGREGLFVPIAKGDLPTFSQRGQTALFMTGGGSEFGGQYVLPVYPPFNGQPNIQGYIWNVQPFAPGNGPKPEQLTPINYYLAGAAGVPNA